MMFGSIMYEGVKMMKDCEFNDRNNDHCFSGILCRCRF